MYEEERDINEELEEENLFGQTKAKGDVFSDDEEGAEEGLDDYEEDDDYGSGYGFQQGPDEDAESEVGELN